MINASSYTLADDALIPTGEDIDDPAVQRPAYGGYDNNFVLNGGNELKFAAMLFDPASGRGFYLYTTEPGLHVYTGNWLDVKNAKDDATYTKYSGVALECQHYPDSPNHPEFPSTTLRPGETYRQTSIFNFYTE